jgi:membrane protease YdiL (CAAX protease family)
MATAALVGLVYGTWFVLRGRNLWPLIIAHGVTDTLSMIAVYMKAMPGTAS